MRKAVFDRQRLVQFQAAAGKRGVVSRDGHGKRAVARRQFKRAGAKFVTAEGIAALHSRRVGDDVLLKRDLYSVIARRRRKRDVIALIEIVGLIVGIARPELLAVVHVPGAVAVLPRQRSDTEFQPQLRAAGKGFFMQHTVAVVVLRARFQAGDIVLIGLDISNVALKVIGVLGKGVVQRQLGTAEIDLARRRVKLRQLIRGDRIAVRHVVRLERAAANADAARLRRERSVCHLQRAFHRDRAVFDVNRVARR